MFWALPLVGIILILKGRIIFILVKAWERIRLGRAAAEHAILFDQSPMHPNLNILVAGDSTAVGVGSDGPQETIAGFFGQAYPNARVVNVGRSGSHAHQLLQQLEPLQHERFDFAVTLIGGNDVVHFTNLDTLPEHLDAYLIALKQIARHNIILTQGNIGNAPLFPGWISSILTRRARRVRELVQHAAERQGVQFVDLFVERSDDNWRKDPKRYYAGDWFHPSTTGYKEWFERIRDQARTLDWLPS